MKIDIFVVCKDEIKIAPYFVQYWKAFGDDVNVFVYDNGSTDGTIEFLNNYDFIHITHFETNGVDDMTFTNIKNNCWKESNADFVMVCDFDETIFSITKEDLVEELNRMKQEGGTILAPLSFSICSDFFKEYNGDDRYLHEICEYGFNDYTMEAKPILFNPKEIKEINYVAGAHCAKPIGNVKWFDSDKLFLIHAKFLGVDYFIDRVERRKLSEANIKYGWFAEKDYTRKGLIDRYENYKSERFKWADIKENFLNYYKIRRDWRGWGIKNI